MKNYEEMTGKELIKALKELSSQENIKHSVCECTIYELEKHQIELKTQNIELQESRRELEESLNRYAMLYDFSPVGYCTLDKKGIIRDINLTGAEMPGIEREMLAGMAFCMFISEDDEEALRKSRSLLAETEKVGHVGGGEFNIDTKKQTWTEEIYNIHEIDLTYEPTVEEGINFYTPESRPIIEQAMQKAIEHCEPYDVELEIIFPGGNHE